MANMLLLFFSAELCAEKYGLSRDAQDAHAIESVARAKRATADGTVAWEIVPVARSGSSPKPSTSTISTTSSKSKDSNDVNIVTEDEAMAKMNPEKLKKLNPFFRKDGNGTVTAGNASPITDGAAAVVLASREAVTRYNLHVVGRILGFADAAQDPKDFPTSPSLAVPLALQRAGVNKEDVDYWEINEAFSVVDLANQKLLGLDYEKVNVFGGAVAIGHPIGASGCRLVVTLLNVLRAKGGKIGVAAICNGGGGASAMVVEKL
jgi:acetyl-CoA C-acetyltransferase